MKRIALCAVLLLSPALVRAAIVEFNLSPHGVSPAVGLSPLNEVPQILASTGSGGEVSPGITFNTDTRFLSLTFGYGSAAGFTDLTSFAISVRLYGPASVTEEGPFQVDLSGFAFPFPDPTKGAMVLGWTVLSEAQTADLMAGRYYVNVGTLFFPYGELRGQLVPVSANTAPTMTCLEPVTVELTSAAGAAVPLSVTVVDAESDPLTVIWTVDGTPLQTNVVNAPPPVGAAPAFTGLFGLGTHTVTVSVSDGHAAPVTCSSTVTVQDTTGPEIEQVVASPDVLWIRNHSMVPVQVQVASSDASGLVQSRILSVTSNEAIIPPGGTVEPDWVIVDAHTVKLRAERTGSGPGRIYWIAVECTDAAGNVSTGTGQVLVPHSSSADEAAPLARQLRLNLR